MVKRRCRNFDEDGKGSCRNPKCKFVHPDQHELWASLSSSQPRYTSSSSAFSAPSRSDSGWGRRQSSGSTGTINQADTPSGNPTSTPSTTWGNSSEDKQASTSSTNTSTTGWGSWGNSTATDKPASTSFTNTSTTGWGNSTATNKQASTSSADTSTPGWGTWGNSTTTEERQASGWGTSTDTGWGESTDTGWGGSGWGASTGGWGSPSTSHHPAEASTSNKTSSTKPAPPVLAPIASTPSTELTDVTSPRATQLAALKFSRPTERKPSLRTQHTNETISEMELSNIERSSLKRKSIDMPPPPPKAPEQPALRLDTRSKPSASVQSSPRIPRSTSVPTTPITPFLAQSGKAESHEEIVRMLMKVVISRVTVDKVASELTIWKDTQLSKQYQYNACAAGAKLDSVRSAYSRKLAKYEQGAGDDFKKLMASPTLSQPPPPKHFDSDAIIQSAENQLVLLEDLLKDAQTLLKERAKALPPDPQQVPAAGVIPAYTELTAKVEEFERSLDETLDNLQNIQTLQLDDVLKGTSIMSQVNGRATSAGQQETPLKDLSQKITHIRSLCTPFTEQMSSLESELQEVDAALVGDQTLLQNIKNDIRLAKEAEERRRQRIRLLQERFKATCDSEQEPPHPLSEVPPEEAEAYIRGLTMAIRENELQPVLTRMLRQFRNTLEQKRCIHAQDIAFILDKIKKQTEFVHNKTGAYVAKYSTPPNASA